MSLTLKDRADRTNGVIAGLRDKPFGWKGRGNCIHLARAQMAAFGHAVPPVPHFTTPIGAKRALHARGFATLEAMIDTMLPRIAPAAMLVGDLCLLPGAAPFQALFVYAGTGMALGWSEQDPSRMRPLAISGSDVIAAWRV